MAPLPHDQDTTSWLQLLSAIEEAEAGGGSARLAEICLSIYSALAAAQFQITQLRATVHALATSRPCSQGQPSDSRSLPGTRAMPAREPSPLSAQLNALLRAVWVSDGNCHG